jgi:hypothetical protein
MDHVADEEGFLGVEVVINEELENGGALVEGLNVGLLEILLDLEPAALRLEVIAVDGAEEEGGQAALLQVIEEVLRVGQQRDAVLQDLEGAVVLVVEFGEDKFGQVLLVEFGEGEINFSRNSSAVQAGFP